MLFPSDYFYRLYRFLHLPLYVLVVKSRWIRLPRIITEVARNGKMKVRLMIKNGLLFEMHLTLSGAELQ